MNTYYKLYKLPLFAIAWIAAKTCPFLAKTEAFSGTYSTLNVNDCLFMCFFKDFNEHVLHHLKVFCKVIYHFNRRSFISDISIF